MISNVQGGSTLVQAFEPRGSSRAAVWSVRAAAVLFVTALTAAASQVSVSIPFTEVPFTMQPMVVLLGGLALGPRLGAAAQLAYLSAGMAGFPVFAASPVLPMGAARLLGPTGGFLLSYPIAAWVVGALAVRGFDRRYVTSVAAMMAGLAVVYAGGVLWLGFAARTSLGGGPIGLEAAIASGVAPFLVGDVLKVLAAGAALPAMWRLLGQARAE